MTATDIIDDFRQGGWHGCIVGPHGTGKSTLLAELGDAAAADGFTVRSVFRNRQGGDPLPGRRDGPVDRQTVWLLDGWCHLPPWTRWRLRRGRRRILGTAHLCGWGLPVRWRTRMSPALFAGLVGELAPDDAMDAADAQGLLRAARGNARTALLALFDAHEKTPPAGRKGS